MTFDVEKAYAKGEYGRLADYYSTKWHKAIKQTVTGYFECKALKERKCLMEVYRRAVSMCNKTELKTMHWLVLNLLHGVPPDTIVWYSLLYWDMLVLETYHYTRKVIPALRLRVRYAASNKMKNESKE